MGRVARRKNRKSYLFATPWRILRNKRYARLKEEEGSGDTPDVSTSHCIPSSTKVRKVRKGRLKVEIRGKLMKRVTERVAKLLTRKKFKQKLCDPDTVSLLSSSEISRESTTEELKKKKLRNKNRRSEGLHEDSTHLICDGEDELESGSSSPTSFSSSKSTDANGLEFCPSSSSQFSRLEFCPSSSSDKSTTGFVDEKRRKRIEARRLRRQKKKVCFNCRQSGHLLQNCPYSRSDSSVAGICFKCGSSEHTSRSCQVTIEDGYYPCATCFICGETGHLSRSCPDNPKGLYPNGGCCNVCGSVEHVKSNCPEKLSKDIKKLDFSTKNLLNNPSASADTEDFEEGLKTALLNSKATLSSTDIRKQIKKISPMHKVVKF